jgi:hypothetical protein
MPAMEVWRYDLPNCFYIVSHADANLLSDQFMKAAGDKHGKFFITELTGNTQGWLDQETWLIMNEKKLPSD